MAQSTIEWTELTWNPTTGCDKVSSGCKFCYAEIMSRRLKAMGMEKYQNGRNGFDLTLQPQALDEPYKWKKPKVIFVNSMSDLFHEKVPFVYLERVFRVMRDNQQHVFQVLTKRAERLSEIHRRLHWPPNVWMGVSVEDERTIWRAELLKKSNAKVKFLSCEPLIGSLTPLSVQGIDWVIVGGESGWKPREMKKEWVLEIKDKCEHDGVPFFFKQWGGTNKKKAGRILDGQVYDQMPLAVGASS